MSDTTAVLIGDHEVLFSNTGLAAFSVCDSESFEIEDVPVYFAGTGVALSGVTGTKAFEINPPDILNASSGLAAVIVTNNKAFLIEVYLPPGKIGDTSFAIDINYGVGPFFPSDPTMTEIIYPVKPISESNKVLFKLDSEEWRATLKASSPRNEETDTVRFRVDTSYLATFLNDLHSNKANQFRLTTPGYTPFGSTSEDNYVRVLSHGRPQREDRGLTQLIDVEFLFMAVYA